MATIHILQLAEISMLIEFLMNKRKIKSINNNKFRENENKNFNDYVCRIRISFV